MLECRAAGQTDAGCLHPVNKDSFFISSDLRVFAIADGMGNDETGVAASRHVVRICQRSLETSPPNYSSRDSIHEWLETSIRTANKELPSCFDPAGQYMAFSTLVLAVRGDDGLVQIAQVGTCHAYKVNFSQIKELTVDRSAVAELVRSGRLTLAQAKLNPYKGYFIPMSLGMAEEVEIDHLLAEFESTDWLLLSSKGLPAAVTEQQIVESLVNPTSPAAYCKRLIELAIDGMAPDNVTVIAVSFIEGSHQ